MVPAAVVPPVAVDEVVVEPPEPEIPPVPLAEPPLPPLAVVPPDAVALLPPEPTPEPPPPPLAVVPPVAVVLAVVPPDEVAVLPPKPTLMLPSEAMLLPPEPPWPVAPPALTLPPAPTPPKPSPLPPEARLPPVLVLPPVGELAPVLSGELQPTRAESAKATERDGLDFIASAPAHCINKYSSSHVRTSWWQKIGWETLSLVQWHKPRGSVSFAKTFLFASAAPRCHLGPTCGFYLTTMASTATGPGPRLMMLMVCCPEVRPLASDTICWAWRAPVAARSAVAVICPSI